MLRRAAFLLLLTCLSGCAGGLGQTFYVQFMPFSATPDSQGQATLQSVIAYANQNKLAPVAIDAYRSGQYVNQVDTMAEERVRVVIAALVQAGIGRGRIEILGTQGGIAYAQGSSMARLPPNTVKIGVGL